MSELVNRRHEWFAQMRAEGLRLEDAYERAGYAPDRSHACRLASRPDVALRINEARVQLERKVTAKPSEVIEGLMQIAKSSRLLGTSSGHKEARIAYLAAGGMQDRAEHADARDRDLIEQQLGRLPPRERRRGLPPEVERAGDPGPAPVFDFDLNEPFILDAYMNPDPDAVAVIEPIDVEPAAHPVPRVTPHD